MVLSFNPVLGFLVVSTRQSRQITAGGSVSIPSWVFWSSRRGVPGSDARIRRVVSIPSWVFWSSRPDQLLDLDLRQSVSIPSWVFWSSRLVRTRVHSIGFHRFNPVLGFLVVSTSAQTIHANLVRPFQSRLGFSGRLDYGIEVTTTIESVSIPSWVFWSSRRPTSKAPRPDWPCFNPVLGFLVVSTITLTTVLL